MHGDGRRITQMDTNKKCMLCPRKCGVDRKMNTGICGVGVLPKVARAALHEWEEPCISGANGSGAIFFSGCALKCVYCQNKEIAGGQSGTELSIERLAEIMLELQNKRAHNINLVTPSHFIEAIIPAIQLAKKSGLCIPIVYNTGSYEEVEVLKQLEGLIDIWLPDLKYIDNEEAMRYSKAPDYFTIASKAVKEMYRQAGGCVFDSEGMLKKGVIVRHLVLPGQVKTAKHILQYLYETYQDKIYVSIMNQYTPVLTGKAAELYPELLRKVTKREYERVVDYAISLGMENVFIQEGEAAKESFIPAFDGRGVEKED